MNRVILIIILSLIVPSALFAQISWTEHTIADDFEGTRSVYAIDLDNDEDIDVLGTAYFQHDIAWWKNDGAENFTKDTIDSTFSGASSVYAIDLDNDEDVDVLGAAKAAYDITWWENDGGSPPNFTEHTIADNFNGASSVYAIDLDNDEDVDVLGAADNADDIAWWENDGGSPPNFTEHTIADNFNGASSVYAIDLDNDDDVDVLGAAKWDYDITWWENDGGSTPNFTEHTIDSTFDGASSVYAIDLDNDDDVDVLGAGSFTIAWWENDGGSPPNFTEHTIDSTFDGASSVYALDLDDDGDVDVLGAANFADDIAWWENDGGSPPNFTEHTIAADFDGARSVYAIDLDDDGDIDVLGGAGKPYGLSINDITWWKSDLADTHDVGPISIDIPSQVPEDTTLNPIATVKNLGTETASFPVTCEIEPGGYMKTQTVQDLTPGDSIQITFFNEFTFESGLYTATVYTRLGDDDIPANDTLEKVIQTYPPGIAEGNSAIPDVFMFSAPTISKGKSDIKLALPEATGVDLVIYDALGRLSSTLISNRLSAGTYTISAKFDLPSGIYFYNLKTASGENVVQKFLLVE